MLAAADLMKQVGLTAGHAKYNSIDLIAGRCMPSREAGPDKAEQQSDFYLCFLEPELSASESLACTGSTGRVFSIL